MWTIIFNERVNNKHNVALLMMVKKKLNDIINLGDCDKLLVNNKKYQKNMEIGGARYLVVYKKVNEETIGVIETKKVRR